MVIEVEYYANATIRESAEKLDYFDIRVIITDEEKAVLDQYAKRMQITDKAGLLLQVIAIGVGRIAEGE